MGYRDRPCPKEARFPRFQDYELIFDQEGIVFRCYARGKTAEARAVFLQDGVGASIEEAARFVERSYISQREGFQAAQRFHPL